MKTKIKRAIKAIVCIAVAAFVIFIGYSFIGNPITEYRIGKHAEEYVKNTYPGTDYEVVDTYYDFKNCDYYAKVESAENENIEFKLQYNLDGSFLDDDFDLLK